MSQSGRFDQLYLTICRQVGGIQGLLKSFFDFMHRKTDFFYEMDPGDTMGFPPGVNVQIDEHYKRFPKKDPQAYQEKLKKYKEKQEKAGIKTTQSQAQLSKQTPAKVETIVNSPPQVQKTNESKPNQEKLVQKTAQAPKRQPKIQPIINTYNGGNTQKYKWSQQSKDVQVTVQVPMGTVAKDLLVQLKIDSVKIVLKKDGSTILNGQFYDKISVSNSFWRVENSGKRTFIVFNLEKATEKIWSTVIKGDKQIDTTKVDNSKPLQDFDEETQGALRKIMYEQQRKMQGLPTTQQEEQMQALKKAWDGEGSPFKGTPFDPSKINFQQG